MVFWWMILNSDAILLSGYGWSSLLQTSPKHCLNLNKSWVLSKVIYYFPKASPPSVLRGSDIGQPSPVAGSFKTSSKALPFAKSKAVWPAWSRWFVGIESLTPRLEFFLDYLLGWTNVYKRLHKLTALVFLGIHLSFACRFVVVSLGWFLERKE